MNPKRITKSTTVAELAAIVSTELAKAGLEAVLSGGSVVTIYSENEYQSHDLDFVTPEKIKDLESVMRNLGFAKKSGRHFAHPDTEFFVEFPSAPLAVGNEPVKKWGKLQTEMGVIQILTPTQSVMDRLAGYFAWNDRQNLDQAVMVAKRHKINFSRVAAWVKAEGAEAKYEIFLAKLKEK